MDAYFVIWYIGEAMCVYKQTTSQTRQTLHNAANYKAARRKPSKGVRCAPRKMRFANVQKKIAKYYVKNSDRFVCVYMCPPRSRILIAVFRMRCAPLFMIHNLFLLFVIFVLAELH